MNETTVNSSFNGVEYSKVDNVEKDNNYITPKWKYIVAFLIYAVPISGSILLQKFFPSANDVEVSPNTEAYGMFLIYLLLFVPLVLIFFKELKMAFLDAIKQKKILKVFVSPFGFLIIVFFTSIATNLLITFLVDVFNLNVAENSENQAALEVVFKGSSVFFLILLIAATSIMGPIVEELIFRKTLIQNNVV